MEAVCYLNPEGELSDKYSGRIPEETLLKGYRAMLTVRLLDERMVTLQRQGAISFALSSFGEEACAVAGAAALEQEDWIYPQYREAGVMFYRGCSLQEYMNQMFGNGEDPFLGRQMPNHFGARRLNVVTVSSPIATKIPHAAGCAYAMLLQEEPHVALAYFGEGATSEGDFHAGLNFAAVRRAPAIFFCRNNGYAISTPVKEQFASDGVAPKGIGYGVKTFKIDGNDFFAVCETVKEAKRLCLAGEGPVLIEALTYRLGAHSTSDDPTRYRSAEEVEEHKKRCPLLRLRRYLEKQRLWDEQKEAVFISETQNGITKAIQTAKKSAPPPLHTLFEHIYKEVPEPLREQYEELRRLFEGEEEPWQ